MPQKSTKGTKSFSESVLCFLCLFVASVSVAACKSVVSRQDVRPKVLRDVPARNLAYRLTADVTPPPSDIDDSSEKFPAVANDFAGKRKDEALLRTVVSP